jgi:iron complex transport system substrate-binding protein
LGPGLLETVYEAILTKLLEDKGLQVERQKPVPIRYQGVELNEGFRLDILLEKELVIELKSVENIHPVHSKQLLTYLRLMDLPLGLLINFGAPLMKEGLHRVVNKHTNFASSRLRAFACIKIFFEYNLYAEGGLVAAEQNLLHPPLQPQPHPLDGSNQIC